jgi:hypothetical protein
VSEKHISRGTQPEKEMRRRGEVSEWGRRWEEGRGRERRGRERTIEKREEGSEKMGVKGVEGRRKWRNGRGNGVREGGEARKGRELRKDRNKNRNKNRNRNRNRRKNQYIVE